MRRLRIAGLILTSLMGLNSCDLFKNSDTVNLTLRISEIGCTYYQDPDDADALGFIEIYNYGDEAVELSNMELRSSASQLGAIDLWEGYFPLPSRSVGAGEYIQLRPSNTYTVSQGWSNDAESGIYYISEGDYFPFWTNYGFAELVSQGQSINFVRWGSTSIASPVEGSYESKASATAWGSTYPGSYSISRYDEDTDTESGLDWDSYTSSTPGEANS